MKRKVKDNSRDTPTYSTVSNEGRIMAQVTTKAATIKEAVQKFEEKSGEKATESKHVKLYHYFIEKMDASLSTLTCCERLSLSTNQIEKIANLNGLKHLKILSLSRNNIKSLTGLDAVGDTLEELWISYNLIEKLKGISVLRKLKVLLISNNNIKDLNEINKLADLSYLEDLLLVGNPICDADGDYQKVVKDKLVKLKKLDGVPVIREEDDDKVEQQQQ